MKNFKETEKINKIIRNLLLSYHNIYKNYKYIYVDNQPVKLNINYNIGYLYQIYKINGKYILNFRLLKNIKVNVKNKRQRNTNPCLYCDNHIGDYIFTCCNKTFNYSCGIYNNFECLCSIDKSELIYNKNLEECVVCFENTNYKTKCNHILCLDCLNKIKKNNNLSLTCPICREGIYKYNKCKYNNINIKIKNNNYIKCNILFIE